MRMSMIGHLVAAVFVCVCVGAEQVPGGIESHLNASLLWGPYRPNLYFGVRPRIPHSLLSGLMWFNVDDYRGIGDLRHACDQGDDMSGFGWTKYDPRAGGREVIRDNTCKIDLVVDFVKTDSGNWGARFRGNPKKGHEHVKTSLVFYTGLEGEGALTSPSSADSLDGDVELVGYSDQLGGAFNVKVTENREYSGKPSSSKLADPRLDPSKTHYLSLHVPDDNVWMARDVFMTVLQESIQQLGTEHEMLNEIPPEQLFTLRNVNNFNGNLHFVQKTFEGRFEFTVTFNGEASGDQITEDNFAAKLDTVLADFDAKFEQKFELQPPFTAPKHRRFAKDFLSNLLGGIGYFYGDSLVDTDTDLDEVTFAQIELSGGEHPPQELFTSIPSRPFFPRGFYWDEGFHLLPISEFDSSLALDILKSWFDLIDDDGWIAREQILGPEARSKVPEDFQVQSPRIANPPTMTLAFIKLLEKAKKAHQAKIGFGAEDVDYEPFGSAGAADLADAYIESPHLLLQYAEHVYPKLQKHYEWFRRTQRGELEEFDRHPTYAREAYRWRGRTLTHCLASGLDDYPRADSPDTAELNVDLISWIGVMTRSMRQMAELLDKEDDVAKYADLESKIVQNIQDLHWSDEDKCYCDVTLDDEDRDVFVCHKGYVSLFPFLHKFVPADSDKLYHIIKLIRDPEELWSPYGIRSLSKSSPLFHSGEDYWRGNIWININYLVLEALQHYANAPETNPKVRLLARVTYKQLRENLVNNIFDNWERKGYAYEQYKEADGEGTRTRHFLGWTSLAVLMMKMPEEA